MKLKFTLISIIHFIYHFDEIYSSTPITVTLENEIKVLGTKVEGENFQYNSFQGIPYAKPPINDLRFKPPLSIPKYDNDIDATSLPNPCPQINRSNNEVIGSEDCLYLNVYVPSDVKEELPVMVWIHGGGFLSGSSIEYGPNFFMETKEVILVTINYRLGALGFLSLDDNIVSGNMGLKDQILALRWVQEHIKSFGGNSNKVTVFGNSAGGISIMALLQSPWSEGLFSQVISQSGPLLDNPFLYFSENPAYYALQYASELGCETEEASNKVLECLNTINTESLITKQDMFQKFHYNINPWVPIADNFSSLPFFTTDPQENMKTGNQIKVPMIIGSVNNEGSIFLPQFLNNPNLYDEINEDFDNLGPLLLLGVDETSITPDEISTANILRLHYLHGNFSQDKNNDIVRLLGDIGLTGPIDQDAKHLASNNGNQPIYYYHYSYRASVSLMDGRTNGVDIGVSHFDECFLLFNFQGVKLNENDKKMSSKMVKLWTDFATNGTPSKEWTPLQDSTRPEMAELNLRSIHMNGRDDVFHRRMDFIHNMFKIIKAYRNFQILEHPAIKSAMEIREKEFEEDAAEDEKFKNNQKEGGNEGEGDFLFDFSNYAENSNDQDDDIDGDAIHDEL